MKIADNVLSLVGNTPILKLSRIASDVDVNIYAKLEAFNPCGSVKDRVGLALIEDGVKKGLVKDNTIIVEPTSGNTGIGLAMTCAVQNRKLILTMPENMSIERRKLLLSLGAEIVLTPKIEGMSGAIKKAHEIVSSSENYYMPSQFENSANPSIHYETTAPEIWDQMDGKIDAIISAVGTGGTITGIAKYMKEKNSDIQIVAVEPAASAVLSGRKSGVHKIQGIGAGFIPDVLDLLNIDSIIAITDDEAISMAKMLIAKEGLLCGISSGAALCGAIKWAENDDVFGKNVVVIFPDTGERYLSTDLFT